MKKEGISSCLELYEKHLLSSPSLLSFIGELRGKELGCWCAPSPCHGDILRKYADKEVEEERKEDREEKEEGEAGKKGKKEKKEKKERIS